MKRYDNALSPRKSLANVRHAIDDGAVAIVDRRHRRRCGLGDGATNAGVPIGVTYDGGIGLVDVKGRPNVFRIAPTDRGIAFRLAEYTIPKGLRLGLLADDTTYGREGAEAMDKAFALEPGGRRARGDAPVRRRGRGAAGAACTAGGRDGAPRLGPGGDDRAPS